METISKNYKESRFSNYDIEVTEFYNFRIFMRGFINNQYATTCFKADDIFQIELSEYKKNKAVVVSGKDEENNQISIYLPEFNVAEVKECVDRVKKEKEKEEEEKIIRAQKRKEEAIEHQKREEEVLLFVKEQYHDIKDSEPVYIFEENDDYVTFMYIDKAKSITIKSVNKLEKEMVASTVKYEHIHYYEKAGAIHYVADFNVEYQTQLLAGSFVPSKLRLTPAVVGGLIFGPMGMAVGAMMGYESSHFDISNSQQRAEVNSKVNKIDDRSIILNYYSEKHKQYMDIELPQETYNFLQTHLEEKKYDIVLEAEKRKYVSDMTRDSSVQRIEETPKTRIEDKKMTLEEFEVAAKKLKIMFENNLISEEEFTTKKLKLFDNI